jgi:hypothetical protein
MSAARNAGNGLPGYTGVNLLPDEIKQAEGAATQRRVIVLLTALVVAAVGAAYFGSLLYAQSSQSSLAAAQAEAAQIVADQAKFGGGLRVANQIKTAKDAQVITTAAEIYWTAVITDVIVATPATISITSIELHAATPVTDGTVPTPPLETSRVGSLTISGVTAAPADIDAWIKGLEKIKGFAGSSVVRFDGGSKYTVVLYISNGRLTNRFATPAPGATATLSPTPTPTPTSTSTPTAGQG